MYQETEGMWAPWFAFLAIMLFLCFVFFQESVFFATLPPLLHSSTLQFDQLNQLFFYYFISILLLTIPAGILLDRFSTRQVSLLVLSICIVSTYAFALSHSYTAIVIYRIITGSSSAFAFLASMQLATRFFPGKKLVLAIAVIIAIIILGNFIVQAPILTLIKTIGWRKAILGDATVGLALLAYMWFTLKDYPKGSSSTTSKIQHRLPSLFRIIFNRQNWLCGGYIAFMSSPIILLSMWGALYLTRAHHATTIQASSIIYSLIIGMLIGLLSIGKLANRLRRRISMLTAASLTFILTLFLIFGHVGAASI